MAVKTQRRWCYITVKNNNKDSETVFSEEPRLLASDLFSLSARAKESGWNNEEYSSLLSAVMKEEAIYNIPLFNTAALSNIEFDLTVKKCYLVEGTRPNSNDTTRNIPKLPSNEKKLLFSVENEKHTERIKTPVYMNPPTIADVDETVIAPYLARSSHDLITPDSPSNDTHFEYVFDNDQFNIGNDIPSDSVPLPTVVEDGTVDSLIDRVKITSEVFDGDPLICPPDSLPVFQIVLTSPLITSHENPNIRVGDLKTDGADNETVFLIDNEPTIVDTSLNTCGEVVQIDVCHLPNVVDSEPPPQYSGPELELL
ncbi:unnamed protein product [Lepeophtheirus salmonis]|uniref:(salmon louse) hypothetical protein n=1 Tax=Lepeophtheirus salmonis TaxID=72036 RepID=A0A7R8D809_LEPSM|nr:unnamed protein product [Lepeophtheirus salmonis]CAF3031354.1 unnamed protein product [Lepeophtheirus salmonis]